MTSESEQIHYVVLFPSVSHVMKAEKILINENISIKIIPVPKSISADCGVCIRIDEKFVERIKAILENHFETIEFRKL